MPSLNPSPEQLADYVAAMPSGVPILMLNLLRYNAQATYPPGSPHSRYLLFGCIKEPCCSFRLWCPWHALHHV